MTGSIPCVELGTFGPSPTSPAAELSTTHITSTLASFPLFPPPLPPPPPGWGNCVSYSHFVEEETQAENTEKCDTGIPPGADTPGTVLARPQEP